MITLQNTIVGTGDFNGDGTTDILWRDADGEVTPIGPGNRAGPAVGTGGDDGGAGLDQLLAQAADQPETTWGSRLDDDEAASGGTPGP